MGLVDDERVVGAQHPVPLDLGEQDAVGHDLDLGRVARPVGETDLEADGLAERGPELLGDAVGDRTRGQPARLGVADGAGHPATDVEADLGQLGGLPGPRLTRDDDDLVSPDGVGDVAAPLADRQLGGEGDRAHAVVRLCLRLSTSGHPSPRRAHRRENRARVGCRFRGRLFVG